MRVISRQDAKAAGLKRYFTGKPCKRGHVSERYVCNKDCAHCLTALHRANPEKRRASVKAWQKKNPEKCRAAAKAWSEANREKHRASVKAWSEANRERKRATDKAWFDANRERKRASVKAWYEANREKHREKHCASVKAWSLANPEKKAAIRAKRRALKLQQRCACCTDADIAAVYAIKTLVAPFIRVEIDHRKPLALGGLHCRRNLQALPKETHMMKTKQDARRIADARALM